MFHKSKKQKLQEIETKKMNENVEKNEDISVNSENVSENPEIVFPSAKDTLETTLNEWKALTAKKIINEIKSCSVGGYRYAEFYHSTISEELVKELEKQGYTVKVFEGSEICAPWVKIYW